MNMPGPWTLQAAIGTVHGVSGLIIRPPEQIKTGGGCQTHQHISDDPGAGPDQTSDFFKTEANFITETELDTGEMKIRNLGKDLF